jgi:DNA-binding NtrC family response regulator
MDAVAIRETHLVTPSETCRVLIADDDMHVLDALQMLLKGCGLSTEAVTHPARALRALQTEKFDAVLMDLNYARDTTEGGEGLDLVSQIRSMDSLLPVVVMTGWSTVDLAVEAMRRGASDFIQKPWENRDLLRKLQNEISGARAQRRAQRQRDEERQEAREIQDSLLTKKLPEVVRGRRLLQRRAYQRATHCALHC